MEKILSYKLYLVILQKITVCGDPAWALRAGLKHIENFEYPFHDCSKYGFTLAAPPQVTEKKNNHLKP